MSVAITLGNNDASKSPGAHRKSRGLPRHARDNHRASKMTDVGAVVFKGVAAIKGQGGAAILGHPGHQQDPPLFEKIFLPLPSPCQLLLARRLVRLIRWGRRRGKRHSRCDRGCFRLACLCLIVGGEYLSRSIFGQEDNLRIEAQRLSKGDHTLFMRSASTSL